MFGYDTNFDYIIITIPLLIFSLTNLYWGTFVVIIAQPLFVSVFAGDAGLGATKILYGAFFALWFGAWLLSRAREKFSRPLLVHVMAGPALALASWLGVASLLGSFYGASLEDIVRDLSQFVGYLAVLPLLDLVRTQTQAKKLIWFLVLLGLPSSIIVDISQIALKQRLEFPVMMQVLTFAGQYWGPVQGALWAVAASFPGLTVKLLAWTWLLLKASLSLFSGYRYMLLMFILAAPTAFLVSGRLARQSLTRYLIPVLLALVVGGVLADLSGLITLPLTDISRDRYGTLLSGERFQQDDSMQGRFRENSWLLEQFLKNPVTGIGLGHALTDSTIPGGYNFYFHNGYLANLMKFGVLGSAIFFWYFLALFRLAFTISRKGNNYFARVMSLGVVIWLVPVLAASWAANFFANRGFALTVGVMAGLLPALAFSPQPAVAAKRQTMPMTPTLAWGFWKPKRVR